MNKCVSIYMKLVVLIYIMTVSALCWADAGLGRHKQLYIVPVPQPDKVVIDGKFDDWDLSGQIEMYVVSETKDMQSGKFAMMYDNEALYLSAVVRDLTPMMNRQDPSVNGNKGWDADSFQFRMTFDPAQPYPIRETAFDYRGKDAKVDKNDYIKHLLLWYYTDRQQPCLQMHMGMGYRLPRPEWAPFGVVPNELFQAKYLKMNDEGGYTFEYKIPWTTLDVKAPLKGGNMVAGTVQFNWGREDGLKTAGGSAWAYDVLSGPGFAFQNAGVWGKFFFAEKGDLSKELVEAGVPAAKPLPLKFTYNLPESGQITLQLIDNDKMVRRILVAQGDRPQGKNVELWDGMDDQGKPLLPGTYICKGVIHKPIKTEFMFSAHNSGIPPYPTNDNKGGWGGDHGSPIACSALKDGMILSWDGCEYGWGIIRVDLNGRKQWGSKQGAFLLANDGKNIFYFDPAGFNAAPGIRVMDAADGRPLNYGNGFPYLQAPDGGTPATDIVTGLAYSKGKVYVSYAARNLIGIFNSVSGKLETTWVAQNPGSLTARPDGGIVGIIDNKLALLNDGKTVVINEKDLAKPAGLTVAVDGKIYVSDGGDNQDVAVFNAEGKLLRRIGKAGGRPAVGNYDVSGMYMPVGVAVDNNNRLWVAEHTDYPKRISVWDTMNGTFEKEYFGGSSYFGFAFINPAVADEIICHNTIWRIDWDKKITTPVSTIWRKTAPDMMNEPIPGAYPFPFKTIVAKNGKQYGIGMGGGDRKTILYRRDGNLFKPFMASFPVSKGYIFGTDELNDRKNTPEGWYLWQDANDDQRMQVGEFYRYNIKNFRLSFKAITSDMTIWADGGNLLKPVRWLDNGQPVYDLAKPDKSFLAGTPHAAGYIWFDDADGSVYTHTPEQRPSLAKWSADGKLQWGFPGIARWPNALSKPVVTAGKLYGMTGPLGVAGDFTGNMSYFGVCHLFNKDGINIAAVMKDGRAGGDLKHECGQPEGQGGQLVSVVTKPGTPPRMFLLGGGQDGRVNEIIGLDSVKPLADFEYSLTADDAKTAADALEDFAKKMGSNKLVIADGLAAIELSTPIEKVYDGTRSFIVKAGHDDKNLYLSYDVTSPFDLINAAVDPKLVFKGGNCLDIQISADSTADPKRKVPVPGDIRLLVTRQISADGKKISPIVVLYRPKVKDFKGEPVILKSPTGSESFDEISVINTVAVKYQKTGTGFKATVTIPLDQFGLSLQKGQAVKMDIGYIYGNETGNTASARSYWTNNSFTANVLNDIPHESRLEPANWGVAKVE